MTVTNLRVPILFYTELTDHEQPDSFVLHHIPNHCYRISLKLTMPSRSSTVYKGHTMTERDVKQANKTTMYLLGGLKRPKDAWLIAAQAEKDKEDAQTKRSSKRKALDAIPPPNTKRPKKAALTKEEQEKKRLEQRARYNKKRREDRAKAKEQKQANADLAGSDVGIRAQRSNTTSTEDTCRPEAVSESQTSPQIQGNQEQITVSHSSYGHDSESVQLSLAPKHDDSTDDILADALADELGKAFCDEPSGMEDSYKPEEFEESEESEGPEGPEESEQETEEPEQETEEAGEHETSDECGLFEEPQMSGEPSESEESEEE